MDAWTVVRERARAGRGVGIVDRVRTKRRNFAKDVSGVRRRERGST